MGRPRQVSDEEILEVACAALVEDPTVSTTAIATRLGLSQAALFKRFGTKTELVLRALGVAGGPPWAAALASGPDARPLPEQLTEIGHAIDRFFVHMVPRMAALRALGIEPHHLFRDCARPPPVVGHEALTAWFARAQAAGRLRRPGTAGDGSVDPAALATVFIGSFHGRAFWRLMLSHRAAEADRTPVPEPAAFVAQVVDVFWRGVAPEEAP